MAWTVRVLSDECHRLKKGGDPVEMTTPIRHYAIRGCFLKILPFSSIPARTARQGVQGGNAEPSERKPRRPRVSAELSRKIAFSFYKKKSARAKSKKCKGNFSARQAAACDGWRRGGSVRLEKSSRKGYNFTAVNL